MTLTARDVIEGKIVRIKTPHQSFKCSCSIPSDIERFAHFLNQLIADEAKSSPFMRLLEFELAMDTLAFSPRKRCCVNWQELPQPMGTHLGGFTLNHDLTILFDVAAQGVMPWPPSLPEEAPLVVVSVLDLKAKSLPDGARFEPGTSLAPESPRLLVLPESNE